MLMPKQQVLRYAVGELLHRARKCASFSLLLLVALLSTAQLGAQSAASLTLITAGRLLDPRTGNALAPAAVLIVGDKIKQVGSPSQIGAPDGARIIDLGGATLLPGLIDSHTHLLLDVIVPPEAESARRNNGDFAPALLLAIVESPNKRVLLGAQLAREDLESGIRPFATLAILESTATLNCATRSTQGVSPVRECWLLDESSSRGANTFRTSIPHWPRRSSSRNSC